jgi:hypothetical protein
MCLWRFCAYFMVRPQLLTHVEALLREGQLQRTPVPFTPRLSWPSVSRTGASSAHENACPVGQGRTQVCIRYLVG